MVKWYVDGRDYFWVCINSIALISPRTTDGF